MAPLLTCPICQEEMLTVTQVNQHIEDMHEKYNPDKTKQFRVLRKAHIDKRALEVHRLENRMGKLLTNIAKVEQEHNGFRRFFVEGARREVEQDLVSWEDEETVDRCRICELKFSCFSRKHHCRLCGKVVCGDLDRNCSREVHSTLLAEKLNKKVVSVFMVRICEDCRNSMFGHQNFIADCKSEPPQSIHLWAALKRRKMKIDNLLPQFQALIEKVAKGAKDPGTLAETKDVRTELYAAIAQFDQTTKRLLSTSNETVSQNKLTQMILLWATDYLQQAMAPLQAVPQVMQNQEEPRLRKDEAQKLQNTMVVLQEQLYMVEGMVTEAKKKRRFDELPPLEQSVVDLTQEINSVAEKLGELAPS